MRKGDKQLERTDQELMQMILTSRARYTIVVDNDAVWIQDNEKNESDEEHWVGFSEYGHNLIPTIFQAIGIKAEFV